MKESGQCVYCGGYGPLTKDHIPPKNLFAKPRPNDLITVPSCYKCHSSNSQVSKDDEYFRLMLTSRDDTGNHPGVQQILPTVWRSLERVGGIGLRESLLKTVRWVEIWSRGGIYLGRRGTYDVNKMRLRRVATRITKGLFSHETSIRLPDSYEVRAILESDLDDAERQTFADEVVRPLMSQPRTTIGKGVFTYCSWHEVQDPNKSAWLLWFYGIPLFLCVTRPQSP
jgi:hypothetical protein